MFYIPFCTNLVLTKPKTKIEHRYELINIPNILGCNIKWLSAAYTDFTCNTIPLSNVILLKPYQDTEKIAMYI